MFQFPEFASYPYVFKVRYLIDNAWKPDTSQPLQRPQNPRCISSDGPWPCEAKRLRALFPRSLEVKRLVKTVQISQAFKVGFPIRKSMDQSLFAAPHGLSQRITSFIACACQGIHQMPLFHLIVLIANAHHLLGLEFLSFSLALKGVPNLTIRTSRICQTQKPITFYNWFVMMPSTCSIWSLYWNYAEQFTCARSLRPASRDQIRYRAVRQR